MADIDMYDYVLRIKQPPIVTIPAPKPETPPKKEEKLTRAQARQKSINEREEVRAWWADLPEEKRQEIRKHGFPTKPKEKKKPEEKVKIIKVEVEVAKPEEKAYIPQDKLQVSQKTQ
jgi:hypothetical protein